MKVLVIVAYYKVVDAVKSVVAIENVRTAIDQIAHPAARGHRQRIRRQLARLRCPPMA